MTLDLPLPILSNLDSVTILKSTSSSSVVNDKPMDKTNANAVVDDPWRTSPSALQAINTSKPMIQINGSNGHHPVAGITSSGPTSMTAAATAPTSRPGTTTAAGSPLSLSEPKAITKLDTTDWFTDVDNVKVVVAPEKEGFIFKHINYVVESQHRSSLVLRRYSDFYWLWEVLLKRYPCRLVPNLPPKKITGRK
jgi:hypothetical protein